MIPDMAVANQFAADLIAQGAAGLAAITTRKLVDERPEMQSRYGPATVMEWRASVASRLGYLAAALATGNPEVFAIQVAWARTAHEARGGQDAADDLIESMRILQQVLREELPDAAGELAANYVQTSLDRARTRSQLSESGLRSPHRQLVAEYLLALLEGDRRRASDRILAARDGRGTVSPLTVHEIYRDVLIPAQVELGRMWHLNEIGVAEEHFATATTQLVMSQLYRYLPVAPSTGKVLVAGSVDGNAHDIGIRMIGDLLESAGWRTVHLGASVPAADFAQAVEHFGGDLAAVSAGLGSQLPVVGATIAKIREADRVIKVMVGGQAFAAGNDSGSTPLWRTVGADGYAANLDEAVELAPRLVGLSNR